MLTDTIVRTLRNDPDYLLKHITQDQAADFLGVTTRCMENWRTRGGGPPFLKKPGRLVRYQRLRLLQWSEAHQRDHTTEPS